MRAVYCLPLIYAVCVKYEPKKSVSPALDTACVKYEPKKSKRAPLLLIVGLLCSGSVSIGHTVQPNPIFPVPISTSIESCLECILSSVEKITAGGVCPAFTLLQVVSTCLCCNVSDMVSQKLIALSAVKHHMNTLHWIAVCVPVGFWLGGAGSILCRWVGGNTLLGR